MFSENANGTAVPRECGMAVQLKGGIDMNKRDICIEAVTQELRAAGLDYQIAHGEKHPRVTFTLNGQQRF